MSKALAAIVLGLFSVVATAPALAQEKKAEPTQKKEEAKKTDKKATDKKAADKKAADKKAEKTVKKGGC